MKIRLRLLAISIGIVYLIFGGLKFFPTLSPAENIGVETVMILSFNLFSSETAIVLLAIFEISIGFLLMCNVCKRIAIVLAISHLVLTFSPFVLFPDQVINYDTLGPSLLGQYIIKNIVLLSALVLLYPSGNEKLIINKLDNYKFNHEND